MPNKTITQVPIVAATGGTIRFVKTAGVWTINYDYDVKDNAGNLLAHKVAGWVPGVAGQAKIQDIEDNLCVPRANQQEGT